jgi:hypothetical protein
MPGKLYKLLIAAFCLLVFCATANAQQTPPAGVKKRSTATQVLNLTGKAAVIIVGQTAKAAWKTTKFTAAEVGKPAARAIFLKAAPKASAFLFKLTGRAIQKGFPIGQKLFVTYLKTRLSI